MSESSASVVEQTSPSTFLWFVQLNTELTINTLIGDGDDNDDDTHRNSSPPPRGYLVLEQH
jgi:hypothetical protein